MHTYTCACKHKHTHTHVQVVTNACTHTHMHTHAYTHKQTCAYMHIHMHIYTCMHARQWHSQATMTDWSIYKSVWANLCILGNTISMQNKHLLKSWEMPQKVLINLKYVSTYVRLITLGSLGKSNHNKSSIQPLTVHIYANKYLCIST